MAGLSGGHTNIGSWQHAHTARAECYIAAWQNEVRAARCKLSGAILRNEEFNFNYVKEVHCLECSGCKQWEGTLTLYERFLVTAIGLLRLSCARGVLQNWKSVI